MPTDYPTINDVRLEVEQAPVPGALRNLILNPSGDLGGWGWRGLTSVNNPPGSPETVISRAPAATYPTAALRFAMPTGITDGYVAAATAPFPVTPGKYVGVYVEEAKASGAGFMSLAFFDAAGAQAGAAVSVDMGSGSSPYRLSLQVPAGAVTGAVYIEGSVNATANEFVLRRFTAAQGDTLASVNNLNYIDPAPIYTNIIGSSVSAKVTREELSVAELVAVVKDVALDPATVNLLRPGRRCRLQARITDGSWATLFLGKVSGTPTVYDYTAEDSSKRAVITLRAVDDIAVLANTPSPNGYATLAQLVGVLEDALVVPWRINGNPSHSVNGTPVNTNPNASALDQIVIARDSAHAFAWMSRDGVLYASDWANLPALNGTLSEADYSPEGPTVTWSTDQIINSVKITHVVRNAITGETTEVEWGPYRDEASIREWGVCHRDFTVQGMTNTDATMRAWAQTVFGRNATPAVRLEAVSFPVRAREDVIARKALVNLYDLIRVTHADSGLDQSARVTKIEHDIAPGSWTVALGFSVPGGSPAGTTPSVVPAVPAGPATVGVTTAEAPHAEVSKSSAQSIANNTPTTVTYPDDVARHGGVSRSSGGFIVPRAGRYLITSGLTFDFTATGRLDVRILKNGGVTYKTFVDPAPTGGTAIDLAGVLLLKAGDFITVSAIQYSGAALNVLDGYLTLTFLD